jgi:hypothetical protein
MSTEAELVAFTEASYQVLWTRNFMLEQGYQLSPAAMFQDNLSIDYLKMENLTLNGQGI